MENFHYISWVFSSIWAKWDEFEVASTEIYTASNEPFREGLLCVSPYIKVLPYGIYAYHDSGLLRDVEAIDCTVLQGLMRDELRNHWLESQGFFHTPVRVIQAL